MLSINTNLSSLIAQSSMKQSTNKLNLAIERMSTGFKINHASDNAANYSIATNMTTKINSYMVAEDNAAMGLDLISTAEGTLSQIQDKLSRLRALAEQSANGTYGEQSKQAINAEANALVDEIERLYNTAEYNGIKMFESSYDSIKSLSAQGMGCDVSAAEGKFIKAVNRIDISTLPAIEDIADTLRTDIGGGTYSVSSIEGLEKLKELMQSDKNDHDDVTIVLANDIDLEGQSITIMPDVGGGDFTFDGNGYVIKNLTDSFFDGDMNLIVKNLGLEEANTLGGVFAISLNCLQMDNCYSTGSVSGTDYVGGLVRHITASRQCIITNSYSTCTVNGGNIAGGLVGHSDYDDVKIHNCLSLVKSETLTGVFIGETTSSVVTDSTYDISLAKQGFALGGNTTNVIGADLNKEIILQVGIDSKESSGIKLSTSFALSGLDSLRGAGISDDMALLEKIDTLLGEVSSKQTHFGATSNRLESVLDEIAIQYDNLVSSRSTIRDADIAEVSASYIQQQILQQASATLLATANQSPSIALQLI